MKPRIDLPGFMFANIRAEAPFPLQHTIVNGEGLTRPEMTFSQMLEETGIDRLPE